MFAIRTISATAEGPANPTTSCTTCAFRSKRDALACAGCRERPQTPCEFEDHSCPARHRIGSSSGHRWSASRARTGCLDENEDVRHSLGAGGTIACGVRRRVIARSSAWSGSKHAAYRAQACARSHQPELTRRQRRPRACAGMTSRTGGPTSYVSACRRPAGLPAVSRSWCAHCRHRHFRRIARRYRPDDCLARRWA